MPRRWALWGPGLVSVPTGGHRTPSSGILFCRWQCPPNGGRQRLPCLPGSASTRHSHQWPGCMREVRAGAVTGHVQAQLSSPDSGRSWLRGLTPTPERAHRPHPAKRAHSRLPSVSPLPASTIRKVGAGEGRCSQTQGQPVVPSASARAGGGLCTCTRWEARGLGPACRQVGDGGGGGGPLAVQPEVLALQTLTMWTPSSCVRT